jgi:hypothetical protein
MMVAFFFREALNDSEPATISQGRLKGRASRGNKLAGIQAPKAP